MERKIKFRAWDKERNEYLSAGSIFIEIQPGMRPDDCVQYLDILNNPNEYVSRFEIEQFTNILDKNNREIFEGDIVEFWSRGVHTTGEVKRNDTEGFFIYNPQVMPMIFNFVPHDGRDSVVIVGNVHYKEKEKIEISKKQTPIGNYEEELWEQRRWDLAKNFFLKTEGHLTTREIAKTIHKVDKIIETYKLPHQELVKHLKEE